MNENKGIIYYETSDKSYEKLRADAYMFNIYA